MNEQCLTVDLELLKLRCHLYLLPIKLTPTLPDMVMTEDMVSHNSFQSRLLDIIERFVPDLAIETLLLYKKPSIKTTDTSATIDYLLLFMLFDIKGFKLDIFSYIYANLHDNNFDILILLQLRAEIASFTIESQDAVSPTFTMHIPSGDGSEDHILDQVPFKGSKTAEVFGVTCFHQFYKLLVCPYIVMGIDELPLRFNNGILSIETSMSTFTFGELEYERSNDTIKLCLTDYQPIFDKLREISEQNVTSLGLMPNGKRFLFSKFLFVVSYLL